MFGRKGYAGSIAGRSRTAGRYKVIDNLESDEDQESPRYKEKND